MERHTKTVPVQAGGTIQESSKFARPISEALSLMVKQCGNLPERQPCGTCPWTVQNLAFPRAGVDGSIALSRAVGG